MITSYITTLKTTFNPFHATSKIPRLFLTLLPPAAHRTVKISTTQLPRASTAPAILEIGFKDGKTVKYNWTAEAPEKAEGNATKAKRVSLQDIVEEVNRHARVMARKQELAG